MVRLEVKGLKKMYSTTSLGEFLGSEVSKHSLFLGNCECVCVSQCFACDYADRQSLPVMSGQSVVECLCV